jgi:hypothetical protein
VKARKLGKIVFTPDKKEPYRPEMNGLWCFMRDTDNTVSAPFMPVYMPFETWKKLDEVQD